MMWQLSALLSLVTLGRSLDSTVMPDYPSQGYQPISKGSRVHAETWSIDNCNTSKKFLKGFPVFIWDATTGKCQRTLLGHVKEPSQVVYSPDGKHMAYPSKNAIHIWETTTWRCVNILTGTHHHGTPEEFMTIAYSPDSKHLAAGILWQKNVGPTHGMVRIWVTATWDSINLTQHMFGVDSVAYSLDGKQLASSDGDNLDGNSTSGSVHIWDTATGKLLKTLHTQRAEVRSVAYSPDGRYLASGNEGLDSEPKKPYIVQIWDTKTWKSPKSIHLPKGPDGDSDILDDLTYSPDGKHLAAYSLNNEIFIWDTGSWKYSKLKGGSKLGDVNDITYSPDGKRLAYVGATDNWVPYIRILDTATWSTLLTWKGPKNADLGSIVFSPDGNHLATHVDLTSDAPLLV